MSAPSAEPLKLASPTSRPRWVLVAVILAVVAAVFAWWFRGSGPASRAELAAKTELTNLGALVVMDAQRVHVNSVNLSTLKSPDTMDQATALLSALPYLHSLNVDGTAFQDTHAEAVGKLPNLQDLVLNHTAVSDAALKKLTNLSKLKTIYLVDTPVSNAGMASLGELSSLNIVDLSGTKVTGGFAALRPLTGLNWLVAQRLSLDAEALGSIGEIEGLKRLSLQGTTYPPEALTELEKKQPELAIDQ